MLKLITCTLLLANHMLPVTQTPTQDFKVYYKSAEVGTLKTTQIKSDQRTTYQLHSEVTINMLAEINIVEHMTDVFKDGKLQNSSYVRTVNKGEKANNTAVRGTNGYVTTSDGKPGQVIKEWIEITVLSLYDREPSDQVMIYSQSFQQMIKLRKLQPHVFELKLPNGYSTSYHYKDGKLQVVASETKWGKIKFVRES